MAAISVNNIQLTIADGSWSEEPVHIGELLERTPSGRIAEGRGVRVRRWTCRTDPFAVADADELEKLIQFLEGRGQSWNFDSASHSLSGAGVTNDAAGSSVTRSASGGVHGGRLTVASGSVWGARLNNKVGVPKTGWTPETGYSVFAWRKFLAAETYAAGWHGVALVGNVTFFRGVSANPAGVNQYVDGVLDNLANLGRCFGVANADPYVSLHGYKTDNSASAVEFDDLLVLPFQVPALWVPSITTWRATVPESLRPRMKISGDLIRDSAPVEVIIRVRGADTVQGVIGGVFKNNLRALDLEIQEWG